MPDGARPATAFHLIVPHPAVAAVLVRSHAGDQGRLPKIDGPERLGDVSAMLAAVAELLGREVAILRIAPISLTSGHHAEDVIIETEPPPDATLPAGCAWLPLADATPASLGPAGIGDSLDRWLAEQRSGTPAARRPSWSRPGFFKRASNWMVDRLAEAGSPAAGPPRLFALWGLSAMLRTDTRDGGAAFLKSCARVFPHEPSITAAVDRVAPGVGPSVVAVEEEEGWLLMRDAGGAALGDGPVERWANGLTMLGSLQRSWTAAPGRIDLEDRGPERLAESIPALVEDPLLDGLTVETRDRLRMAVPRLLDGCERIARLGPGPSIVHGDFHPWNLQETDGRITIIDWSDSCLGHPFFDLPTFVGRTRDTGARGAMVAAYLDGWSSHGRRADLEEAAALALPLGALHQAESYRRIVASVEPDDLWDLEEGGRSHASDVLDWLDHGLSADAGF